MLWRKFPSLFYPAFALHEILSKYGSAAEHLLGTLPESKASEIARLRRERLPPWGRKHPKLFGAESATATAAAARASVDRNEKNPRTSRAARSSGGGVKSDAGGFSKLDLFELGLLAGGNAGAWATGDAADGGGNGGDGARTRSRRSADGSVISVNTLSKAARAHTKLKQQRQRQFQSVVDEARKHHKERLRQQMWDAEQMSTDDDDHDKKRMTPARHAAPPSAILSPSLGVSLSHRVSQSQSRRGSLWERNGGNTNILTENEHPNVGSPTMNEIWAAMQKPKPATMSGTPTVGDRDPILCPTPEKRGSALAPLPITPEPPNSQQKQWQRQPGRWQNATRSRNSSSLSGAIKGGIIIPADPELPDPDSFPSDSLKSPEQESGGSVTIDLRVAAARGGGGVNGGGRPVHRGRGAQRGARQASMRRQAAMRLETSDDREATVEVEGGHQSLKVMR